MKKTFKSPLVKNALIYTLSDVINKSIPFLLLPFLTSFLNPSDYGIVSNFQTLFALALVLITIGAPNYYNTVFYKNKQSRNNIIVDNIIITHLSVAILILVFILTSHAKIEAMLHLNLSWQLLALIVAIFSTLTLLNLTYYRLSDKPFQFAGVEIILTIINFSLSIILIYYFDMAGAGRILGIAISQIFIGVVSFLVILSRSKFKVRIQIKEIKNILRFGLPIIPHGISIWFRSGFERVVITSAFGTASVGIYATGFQLGLVLSILTVSFNKAFSPYIYENLASVTYDKKVKLVRLTYLYFILITLLAILIWIIESVFVKYFLNVRYASSIEFIPWILFAFAFQGMYFMVVNYIFYIHKTKILALITFSTSFLHIILSIWLIPKFGPLVAAKLFLLVNFLTFIFTWFYSSKVYKMPWNVFK